MNRTFNTLKSNVGKMVGDSSTSMLALIAGFINDRATEIYRRCNLLDVNRGDYSFSVTAGTEDYPLPSDFGKELTVVDKTNGKKLSRIDVQENIDYNYASLDTAGSVDGYMLMDKTVRAQPSAASQLSIKSASASDTTQTVYIKGLDTDGYETYEEQTLTGTSAVTSTYTYTRILLISKSAATVGAVTITSNAAAVTNAIMSREMLEHRVKVLRLVSVPNSGITVEMNYIQRILPMSQDYDYPIIDCGEVLEAGATADAWRFKRQFGKAADLDVIFEKRLANLQFDYESQPNKVQLFKPRISGRYEGNVDDCRRYGVF